MHTLFYVCCFFIYLDSDECAINNGGCTSNATDTSGCTVVCYNTPGSFQCVCGDGYMLDTDMLTCIGKLKLIFF